MRQFCSFYRFSILLVASFLLIFGLSGCGSKKSSTPAPITMALTPSIVSLNGGDVLALQASCTQSNSPITCPGNVTWTTDNANLVSLTPNGSKCGSASNTITCLCGGKWDTDIIVCTPPTTSGTAKITATQGSLTASLTAFVHPRVARVEVTAPVNDCTSSTGTLQLTAKAFDAGGNEITVGPADGSGFLWSSTDSTIVTPDTKGLLTAVNPGKANVSASVSNVVSPPVSFTTCPVKKISAHVKDVTDTSFTVDKSATKTLVADVLDSKDKTITITGSKLIWASTHLGVATTDQAGLVTASNPGTSAIVVACSPPQCNTGLNSVFSNPVVANVNGSTTPNLVVASPSSTSLFPIDNGTVGSAVTLPFAPNSIIYARTGLGAYLGSDTTLMALNGGNNTASAIRLSAGSVNIPGIVIGTSNDAGLVAVFDNTANTVSVVKVVNSDTSSNITQVDKFTVSGIANPCKPANQCPVASFTPDNKTAYIVAGSNLYVSTSGASLKTFPLGQTARDIAVSGQGSFAYIGTGSSSVDVYATCNNSKLGANSVALSAVPQAIESSTDGSKIFAVTPPSMNVITATTDGVGCPPSLTDPLATVDLGHGAFTTQDMFVTTNGSKVILLTSGTDVILYDVAAGTADPVTLSGGATVLSGGVTPDGASVFVGGSDKKIHRIDVATKSDASQITVTITPDLVAVRPK
jgi:hypothetical protein